MSNLAGMAILSTLSISWMNTGGLPSGTGLSFKALTESVTVAVNSNVCLWSDDGNTSKHLPRSLPKELLNNLSASSKTKYFTLLKPEMVSSPECIM
ncbi:hypothetical protein WICPIJ_002396 [Wickerhamomyces pijperi]|uniref:Secreted protein n=1 Tax=Wickerhamomyces pijperi TaxID=599730 RepID=A0A9P8TQ86_WICPI|nr:hypothetical protein WICPIJ_002396 [Wickerhamomyces pijperi]